ncbi:MAG TPA: DNA-processing protein DprA, partial [Roseobacter sp.]|nr:DNA-processing protein DprA [Roseobacter sp.]
DAGYVVVSGLARGVDAAAHLAALPSGTIAVQAGGVDVMYPVENTRLAGDISQQGLRISEQPIGLQPMARHFPSRNRIIAGLSHATVIVEAAARSGSLITARDALDQGREVLAVPGHPFDARAAGCNMLIRDGATLVRDVADVIELLGPLKEDTGPAAQQRPVETPKSVAPDMRTTAAIHARILSRLGPSPIAEDQLIRDLKLAPASVTAVLVELELNGHVLRQSGGLISRTN